MKRKLIAFDLDGTLLDSHKTIRPRIKWALERAKKAGHVVIIASSRPIRSVVDIAKKHGLDDVPIIAHGGAMVIEKDKVLISHTMQKKCVRTCLQKARAEKLHINLYSDWKWIISEITDWSQKEIRLIGFEPELHKGPLDENIWPLHRMMVVGKDAQQISRFKDSILGATEHINVSRSRPTYCEMLDSKASKGNALLELATYMGIAHADTVAFGDGENDLDMVQKAGKGVAMGNAMSCLRESADVVIGDHDSDAIADFFENEGLM